jgi:hypothetical protein
VSGQVRSGGSKWILAFSLLASIALRSISRLSPVGAYVSSMFSKFNYDAENLDDRFLIVRRDAAEELLHPSFKHSRSSGHDV